MREILLPSDSGNRPDIQHMLEKNFDEAERRKNEMEELQRRDKHLRSQAEKARGKK